MSVVIQADQIYAAMTVIVSVGTTAGVMAYRYGRKLGPLIKAMTLFHDDWYGVPGRPGFDPRPGLAERTQRTERTAVELAQTMATLADSLAQVQRELAANGGGSLRDQVRRIEQAQRSMASAVGAPTPLPLPAAELAALAVASEQHRSRQDQAA
jgi:hypothetical protein